MDEIFPSISYLYEAIINFVFIPSLIFGLALWLYSIICLLLEKQLSGWQKLNWAILLIIFPIGSLIYIIKRRRQLPNLFVAWLTIFAIYCLVGLLCSAYLAGYSRGHHQALDKVKDLVAKTKSEHLTKKQFGQQFCRIIAPYIHRIPGWYKYVNLPVECIFCILWGITFVFIFLDKDLSVRSKIVWAFACFVLNLIACLWYASRRREEFRALFFGWLVTVLVMHLMMGIFLGFHGGLLRGHYEIIYKTGEIIRTLWGQ